MLINLSKPFRSFFSNLTHVYIALNITLLGSMNLPFIKIYFGFILKGKRVDRVQQLSKNHHVNQL
jgi:hypothetical protein